MSDDCKHYFRISMLDDVDEWIEQNKDEYNEMHEVEQEYIKQHREITDFKKGFKAVGKLLPKTIKGGVVLCKTMFEIRQKRGSKIYGNNSFCIKWL